jgi:hypothetical protein
MIQAAGATRAVRVTQILPFARERSRRHPPAAGTPQEQRLCPPRYGDAAIPSWRVDEVVENTYIATKAKRMVKRQTLE